MKKRVQKCMTSLAIAAILGLQAGSVMAASVSFNNAAIATGNYSETYVSIISKAKADNEQYWYVTITGSTKLGTTGNPRAILTSAKNETQARSSSSKLGLYKNMTGVQRMKYPTTVKKGQVHYLFGTGNNNIKKVRTVTISGRYTS